MTTTLKKKNLFGDKAMLKTFFAILIPIIVQNAFTQFVSLLDNLMVGRLGTESMSGVSIANQLFFVFNLTIFGVNACASILGAQYAGKRDREGIQMTLRFRLIFGLAATAIWIVVLIFGGEMLISRFLTDDGSGDIALTLSEGRAYLNIMLWGLAPFALAQNYAGSLRENSETRLPMISSIAAVLVNFVLNYLLIFGKLGFPELGVKGAAIATVISRYVEAAITILVTQIAAWKLGKKRKALRAQQRAEAKLQLAENLLGEFKEIPEEDEYEFEVPEHPMCFSERVYFAKGLISHFKLPFSEVIHILKKGALLIMNEFMWALGNTILARQYSLRGLTAVAALNIGNTINNLFMISVFSTGAAIGIICGQYLGRGETEEAKVVAKKSLFFSVCLCAVFGGLLAIFAPWIPQLYKTEPAIKALATSLLFVNSIYIPVDSFINGCYFVIRSGGKVLITFLFDSGYVCFVLAPILFGLVHWTTLPFLVVYIIIKAVDLIKIIIGFILVKKGTWAVSLVQKEKE